MAGSILGHAVRRTEDARLVTGAARYLEDFQIEGALHVAFVRSPLAHARIVSKIIYSRPPLTWVQMRALAPLDVFVTGFISQR